MKRASTLLVLFAAAGFALAGCRTAEDAIFIGLAGEAPGQPKEVEWQKELEKERAAKKAAQEAKAAPKPLVTIRFTSPDVKYTDELYRAVSYAVERRPDVLFDVFAIVPGNPSEGVSSTSRGRIDGVLATLAGIGIPANRVRLSSVVKPGVTHEEVRIYAR